jgi:hypothetical protein
MNVLFYILLQGCPPESLARAATGCYAVRGVPKQHEYKESLLKQCDNCYNGDTARYRRQFRPQTVFICVFT